MPACIAIQDPFQVYETQIAFADGSRHDVLYSKALYHQSNGEVGGIVGVMTDTTDRTRHEQEIAEAHQRMARQAEELKRSNAELEQFAYVASHDLREPLRMVNSYLSLLQRRYGDKLDQDAKEFIGFARDGGVRMDRLILDLLEYSRVGRRSKPMAPTSVGDVIATACHNLEVAITERGTILHVPADLPAVQADSNELTRLFQNLIGNAIKYCAPGNGAGNHHRVDGRAGPLALRRARQRPWHSAGTFRPRLHGVPAPAQPGRIRRHRHRPRDLPEDRGAPWRPDLADLRTGQGQHLPLHAGEAGGRCRWRRERR